MIYYIDASAFAKASCLKQLFNTVARGYTDKRKDISIEYGVAFHKCAQTLEETNGDEMKSILVAQEHLRNVWPYLQIPKSKDHLDNAHLTMLCARYSKHKNEKENFKVIRKDGKPIVEQKFAIPFYKQGDNEFILSGTIDRVVEMNQSRLCVLRDYKTTSVWDIKNYLSKYRLSGQMRVYLYAIRWYAQNYPNSIFAELWNRNVGVCIDGVFLKSSPIECTFVSSEVMYFRRDDIDEIEHLMMEKVKQLADAIDAYTTTNKLPPRYGVLTSACDSQKFGACSFYGACSAPDRTAEEMILKQNFNQKQYNPLKFHE